MTLLFDLTVECDLPKAIAAFEDLPIGDIHYFLFTGDALTIFTQRVGGDILDLTWAWAAYLTVTGLGMLAVGQIGDRVGHHTLSVIGYALTSFFTFGYLLVQTPFELFVVQAGLGLALAFSNPTWDALYDKYSGDGSQDGTVWGYASAGRYIAQAAAICIGGLVITYASFEALFIVMGCVSLLATFYQARILRYRNA
jgi:MFS family permease